VYSNNKLIRDVAEAAAKIMYGQKPVEEELKGNQKAIDKNHNNKIDGQDFAILRGEKKAIKEEDAYDKDRYAVKNGKAVKDNPAHMGSKDEPHHVWAKSADEALKKKMKEEVEQIDEDMMGYKARQKHDDKWRIHSPEGEHIGDVTKHENGWQYHAGHHSKWNGSKDSPHYKTGVEKTRAAASRKVASIHKSSLSESVELEEGIEDRLEAARAKAKAAGKPIKDKPTPPKSNVRKIEGSAYGGARQKDEPEDDDDDTPAKKTVKYGARQNYKRSTRVNESFTEMLTRYDQEGLKPFIESLSREEEEELIDDLSTEIADETLDVIDAGSYTEVTIGEEADTEEFTKNLETNKAKSSGKVKQPDLAKGDVMAVKNEEVELTERHMTDAEMQKRETIVKSMKKGLSGFKQRYGDRAKDVMYATATKQAMK